MEEKKTTTRASGSSARAANKESSAQQDKPMIPKDVDVHQYITVRNGFHGKLVFISKRTGEEFVWESFGDEQDIELIDLRSAKSSSKKFFTENYFMFNDEDSWVIDYLGVGQFYRNALKLDEFDDLFDKSPAEVEKTVRSLSAGQQRSVAYRAKQLIADGEIDSHKVITALEKALGIDLIER